MKTKLLSLILLALALVLPGRAQPTFTVTTLSAALTSSALTLTVASATGITANTTVLKIDNEILGVSSVSGTTIGVRRGQQGTRAQNHGNTRAVYIAPPQNFNLCGGTAAGGNPCGDLYNAGTITHFAAGLFFPTTQATAIATAGNVTYTSGQILSGLILRDDGGSGRTDVLPTAALLVAAIPGATVGTSIRFHLRSVGSNTITVSAGTGGTTSGTMTVATANGKDFLLRLTAVALGAETYTIYSLGTATF
jgi:hypothetical protein